MKSWLAVGFLMLASRAFAGAIEPRHFDHAEHRGRGVSTCNLCHTVDAKGVAATPGAMGHAPCLDAKCHAEDFLASGPKTRTTDPVRYARAAGLCRGCHDTADGQAPSPASKPPTNTIKESFKIDREYHVEMNHAFHAVGRTKVADCSECHEVDKVTFKLVAGAPGHAQCVRCHSKGLDLTLDMSMCDHCHKTPSRALYMAPPHRAAGMPKGRPNLDVRACGSEGHAALEARFGRVSCFRHETKNHRFELDPTTKTVKPVECVHCHTLVERRAYKDLPTLHNEAIIEPTDAAHAGCGTSGCHVGQFDPSVKGACRKCHGDHSRNEFQ